MAVREYKLTDEVAVPDNLNTGLTVAGQDFMIRLLGKPRDKFTQSDEPVTNMALAAIIVTANVGPFTAKGLLSAVASLTSVMADVAKEQPRVYAILDQVGMLVVRNRRPNPDKPRAIPKISNHAWGTAIDLKLSKKLDPFANGKTFYGLALIAPIFNQHGWFWGGRFRGLEDAMHFEVSKEKLMEWERAGIFRQFSKSRQETIPPVASRQVNMSSSHDRRLFDFLRRGDVGAGVVLLQNALKARDYRLAADGCFGKLTELALVDFKRKHGLIANGIVGPKTAFYLGLH